MSTKNPVGREFHTGERPTEYLVRLRYVGAEVIWIDFEIIKVIAYEMNGARLYGCDLQDMKPNPDEAKAELTGFVKWDGCTQMYFTDAPHIHVDDSDGLKLLFDTIAEARRVALVDVMDEPDSV